MEFSKLRNKIGILINAELSDDVIGNLLTLCREYEGHKDREMMHLAWMASNIASGLVTYANGDYKKVALISVDIAKQIATKVENKKR